MALVPKISGASIGEHREKTSARIFRATRELIREHGLQPFSLADVAARAGVGRTAIYNYFPDRETLLLEFMSGETEDYLDSLRFALGEVSHPIERLQVFIRLQMEELVAQHVPTSGMLDLLGEAHRARLIEHVRPITAILRDALVDAQEERYLPVQDTSVAVALVMATVSGRSTSRLGDAEAFEDKVASTTEYVLRGLGARLGPGGAARRLPAARHG